MRYNNIPDAEFLDHVLCTIFYDNALGDLKGFFKNVKQMQRGDNFCICHKHREYPLTHPARTESWPHVAYMVAVIGTNVSDINRLLEGKGYGRDYRFRSSVDNEGRTVIEPTYPHVCIYLRDFRQILHKLWKEKHPDVPQEAQA